MDTIMIRVGECTYELKRKGEHSRVFDVIAAHTKVARSNAEQWVGVSFFKGDNVLFWSMGHGQSIQRQVNAIA